MNIWLFLSLMGGLLIVLVLTLFWHPQRRRTKVSPPIDYLDRQPISDVFRDDDRYWYGGIFYNNPDDPVVFVPKRFGIGWTVNFGHPQGRLIIFLILPLPLVIGILSILLIGTTPIGCHPSGCYPVP